MMVSRDEQASNQTWGLTPGALPVGVRFSQTQNLSLRISFLVQFLLGQEKGKWGCSNQRPCCKHVLPLQPIAITAPTCDATHGLRPGGLHTAPGSNERMTAREEPIVWVKCQS